MPLRQIAATLGVPKSTCLNIYKHVYKNATEKKEVALVLPGEITMLRESTAPSEITTPSEIATLREITTPSETATPSEIVTLRVGEVTISSKIVMPREIVMSRERSELNEVAAGARGLEELEERLLQLTLREDPIGSNRNTASSVTSTTLVLIDCRVDQFRLLVPGYQIPRTSTQLSGHGH